MVQIKKQLVSQDVINKRSYGKGNPITSITVHQTGNPNKGANAEMHARLQTNLNPRQASWHYSVDDKQVVQSFPDDIRCWHATDGRGPGNTTSLAIEICINSDGDYNKAVENATELVKIKLKEYGLRIADVKKHFDWFNKFCPQQLMSGHKGISWDDFINMVESDVKPPAKKPVKKPVSKPVAKPKLVVDGYMGPLTIMELQRYFKTVVDGYLSKPSLVIRKLQKLVGAKQDGYLGPITIRAMQKRFGTPQDGIISKPSLVIKELQKRLNKGKL